MDSVETGSAEPSGATRGTLPTWAGAALFAFAAFGVAVAFLSQRAAEQRARDKFLFAIARAREIQLGNQRVTDPTPLFLVLRLIDHEPRHHSSPTKPIALILTDGNKASVFLLARDSERPTEFWIFQPGGSSESGLGQYAGSITSNDLDRILRGMNL
jgi:hypothetical protein